MQAVYDRLHTVIVSSLVKVKGMESAGVKGPFLDIIIALGPTIIPLLINCFSGPKAAAGEANRPGLLSRLTLRRKIREALDGGDGDTLAAREHLFQACLAAGKTLTEEELATVTAELTA